MKTIKINLYKFAELSESAQQKAIEKLADINVDYQWWESTYEDAKEIGLKITSFDIDRGSYCNGDFIESSISCARSIIESHGETTETYKTAQSFLTAWEAKEKEYDAKRETEDFDSYEYDNEYDEMSEEFLKSLLEDYRIILQKEYEYLTSEEAIKETIEANEYDFTEDGSIY